MLEMNLTLQIVICLALGLLAGGWLLYRRQAKELAEKTEELKRQKFQNKQLIIIEEILSKLNHKNHQTESRPPVHPEGQASGESHKNGHAFSKTNAMTDPLAEKLATARQKPQNNPPHNRSVLQQIPLEPVAISNPIRRNINLPTDQQPPPVVISATTTMTNEGAIPASPLGPAPPMGPVDKDQCAKTEQENHSEENQTASQNTDVGNADSETKGLLERLQSSSPPLTERLNKAEKKHSFNPFKSRSITSRKQPPQKEAQLPEQEAAKSVFTPPGVSLSSVSPAEEKIKFETIPPAKKAPPIKRRGENIPAPLNLDQDSNLYTRINDYARWVAAHSDRFRLDYYENGQPAGHISLVFNQEELARLNGHWFDMFRPYDLDEILDIYNSSENTLYCSYSAETIEQLRAPALQILAYVDSEDNKRYQTVIEECALKEFVHYLGDLKQLAATR